MCRLLPAVIIVAAGLRVNAEIARFKDPYPRGNVLEYWRLTHEPAIRDHANYHNTQCWSPDGTKICFVSNYDFQHAPFTTIATTVEGEAESLAVASTAGFPTSGEINVLGEVIGYTSKTPTSFDGLQRHKDGTGKYPFLKAGWYATSFGARRMTAGERKRAIPPWEWLCEAVGGDRQGPLLWQRQTDIYVSVVRLPDPPHLRMSGGRVELIPGENHWETFGYRLERDGERVNAEPLRPGTTLSLEKAGTYRAAAVEWSGLAGRKGLPLKLDHPGSLAVLAERPADFSWTRRVWLVAGREVAEADARRAAEAVCETRHLHDGVIRREQYRRGQLVAAEHLNADGKATRRLTVAGGKLATREYWTPRGERVSLERFGPDGFKTEEIRWRQVDGEAEERDRWLYERGWPLKRIIKGGREVYEKRGDEWVRMK